MEYSNPIKLKELSCCICDKSLFKLDPVYKKYRKLNEYRDIYMQFTNDQKMRVSTCSDCFKTFDIEAGKFVLERHKIYWQDEFENPRLDKHLSVKENTLSHLISLEVKEIYK